MSIETVIFMVLSLLLLIGLCGLVCFLCNCHKGILEQDWQFSRLQQNVNDVESHNPNIIYSCDNIISGFIDGKSLPQVERKSLSLVDVLGQGGFGQVNLSHYRHRKNDAVAMLVAVKTLSTNQLEESFLLEAAIIAKFSNHNIVHLIGVCLDCYPKLIVLEPLFGGHLDSFLREGRSTLEHPSPLTMKDLIFFALDVARGCCHMESKGFIHGHIAARNCLLSSKCSGRVVKIANFSMARDFYRSDNIRKDDKPELPIKWMPPEAFRDGLFTPKTDVWSFGVLLWEVFSMGLMPYTGLSNPELMKLLIEGSRLDCLPGCPADIYCIMFDCWNSTPEDRPTFYTLLERLTACSLNLDIMNAAVPNTFRKQLTEHNSAVVRLPAGNQFCSDVSHSSCKSFNGNEYPKTSEAFIHSGLPIGRSNINKPPTVTLTTIPDTSEEEDEENIFRETSL